MLIHDVNNIYTNHMFFIVTMSMHVQSPQEPKIQNKFGLYQWVLP